MLMSRLAHVVSPDEVRKAAFVTFGSAPKSDTHAPSGRIRRIRGLGPLPCGTGLLQLRFPGVGDRLVPSICLPAVGAMLFAYADTTKQLRGRVTAKPHRTL